MKGSKTWLSFGVLAALVGWLFFVPAFAIEEKDFSEDDIENEEALANSDAAIAEKDELKKLRENEKKRAAAEKVAAEKAKARAKVAQKEANIASDKLYKDLKAWRAERKIQETARKAAEADEAAERRKIEKIKLDRDKEQALLDAAKKSKTDAVAAFKAARNLNKTLQSDLEKMKRDRLENIKTAQKFQNGAKDFAAKNEKLEKQIVNGSNYKVPAPVKAGSSTMSSKGTSNATRKPSRMPEERMLAQDCNLRLGPKTTAEVYKILKKGETVLVHSLEGAWYSVGTKEVDKAYLSKPCL